MIVVAADRQQIKLVTVDKITIVVTETYDVIVKPKGATRCTLHAQSMGRSGNCRLALSTELGAQADILMLR
jgi:FtsP/CotA-like multicopper oxidase with cupredoxin domain